MEELVELREGWWWPKYDMSCFKFLSKRTQLPKLISKYCKKKRTLIQAGGNAGMYVNLYSKLFDTVYTFEPDPINFYCLTKNTGSNVIKFQGCLGNKPTFVNLNYNEVNPKKPNCGGLAIAGQGKIPVFRIDSFEFEECDLIHLDIEGYEKFALLGAIATIEKCKPVIALELNSLSERYDSNNEEVINLITSIGYTHVDTIEEEYIFIKK